jgi:hypothetical protein
MGRRVIELYDSLLSGNDLEITPRLTLQRRPGYVSYASGNTFSEVINMYSWKTASQGVYQIFDTSTDIEYVPPGSTSPTVIFTKPAGTFLNKSYFYGVGNYLFVSGIGFAFKWDGPNGKQGVTNWGISLSQASFGPTICTTGANSNAISPGVAWTNPTSVTGASSFASVTLPLNTQSRALQCSGFNFSVTAGTIISGIQVTATVSVPTSGVEFVLYGPGGFIGIPKPVHQLAVPTAISLGNASDLWGASSITTAQTNSSAFSIIVIASGFPPGGGPGTVKLNDVVVTIFSGGPITGTPTSSGTFSAINGFSYVQAYGNSVSGEISNATVQGINTGPFTNAAYVAVPVVASPDTQVDQIHVYRTTDSGGGSIFYELPNSPFANATVSPGIHDAAADTALNLNSQAATNFQNTPPPANLTALEWFAGRLWGAVGNQLFFSTGPDSLSGLQQSNWNPVYVFVIPTSVTRLTSLPNGMLIQDLDEILVVRGTSTTSFTVNSFIRDTGLWNYNASDSDGSNVYMFTADRQFIVVSANGVEEVGPSGVSPIADQLQNVDPTQAYVTAYRSGLDAMIFLLDIANQVLYPYNSRQQAWCLPALLKMQHITGAGAMEVQPGVWKYLIGSNGPTGLTPLLGQRDLNTFTDLGTPYAPQVVIGTIQEADPGTLTKMENVFLELTSAGSVPTISILPNDQGVTLTNPVGSQITGKFIPLINPVPDPPTYGAQPINYRSLRYYWLTSPSPEAVKYVQILIQFIAENEQNEILGLGLSGKQSGDSPAPGALPQLQGH